MAKTIPSINTPAGRVVFIRAPKRLNEQQVTLALASMADDDPRWLAFHQLLDEELATAALDSSSAQLTDAMIRHAGGRMEALSVLKNRLLNERQRPIAPAKTTRET